MTPGASTAASAFGTASGDQISDSPCADILFLGVRGSREDPTADAGMGSTVYALYSEFRHDLPAGTNLLGKALS